MLPDDEEAWERERLELLRERYVELNGADPARSDPSMVQLARIGCKWPDKHL